MAKRCRVNSACCLGEPCAFGYFCLAFGSFIGGGVLCDMGGTVNIGIGAALFAVAALSVIGCTMALCRCSCKCKKKKKAVQNDNLQKASAYKDIELVMSNDNNRTDEDLKHLDESVLNNRYEQINRSLERDARLATELYNGREAQDLESLRNECYGSELFKIPKYLPTSDGDGNYIENGCSNII